MERVPRRLQDKRSSRSDVAIISSIADRDRKQKSDRQRRYRIWILKKSRGVLNRADVTASATKRNAKETSTRAAVTGA